jgi:hypothetical protein
MKTIFCILILLIFAAFLFGCETVDQERPPHHHTTTTTTEETTVRRPAFGAAYQNRDNRPYYRTTGERTYADQPATRVIETETIRSF